MSDGIDEFFDYLTQGKNFVTNIPKNRIMEEKYSGFYGGFLENIDKFDPMFFHIAPKDARLIDPQERMMLKVIWEVLEDAGYTRESLNATGSTGVFIGNMYDHYSFQNEQGKPVHFGGRRWEIVNRCSYFYDFKGPSMAIDCACSTSLAAIHMACKSILDGECHTAIAAAVNLSLDLIKYDTLKVLGMLETDSVSHSLSPGSGYIPCEGIGAVLLKSYDEAVRDHDNIYAVINASGINHGGTTDGFTIQGENAEKELILDTLKKDELKVSDIDYYELSTTGCSVGDEIEMKVIKDLFHEYGIGPNGCRVGTVKTNLGHLEAASGMSQFTKVVLQLKYEMLVPSINVADSYEAYFKENGLTVQKTLENWNLAQSAGVTAINSFGVGGSNAFCVVSKAREKKDVVGHKRRYMMIFSSYKAEALKHTVKKMINYLKKVRENVKFAKGNRFCLERMEYTLMVGREQFAKRLVIFCETLDELIAKLEAYQAGDYEHVLYRELTEDECIMAGEATLQPDMDAIDAATLWLTGVKLDFNMFFTRDVRKISLPKLSFVEKSYWLDKKSTGIDMKKEDTKAVKKEGETEGKVKEKKNEDEKSEAKTVKDILKNILAGVLGCNIEDIAEQTRFHDLGADSLLILRISEEASKRFKKTIKPAMLYDYYSVDKLASYIEKLDIENFLVQEGFQSPSHKGQAIIGMAGRFPGSETVQQFWENLKSGIDSVGKPPVDRKGFEEENIGGFLDNINDFDAEKYGIINVEAKNMDPRQRLLVTEVWKAIEDAGITREELNGQRCGVFVGAGSGDYIYTDAFEESSLSAFSLTGTNSAMMAGRISYLLNLKGPALTIDTACSSSLTALHVAISGIVQGDCDMAIVAGVNLMQTSILHRMGNKGEMLSKTGKCKAFSQDADGFVPSEGVGVIIIRPEEKASQENKKIYAVIEGSAMNEDGATNGITAPSVSSQQELETRLYQKLRLNPENIGYVEAHGTGTKLGDPIEVEALTNTYKTFTSKKQFCAIGSVKSNIGHGLYCAGITGLIKAALCLYYKTLVPTLHAEQENSLIDFKNSPFYLCRELKHWESDKPRFATVSSFGFSGNNVHVVLKESNYSKKINYPRIEETENEIYYPENTEKKGNVCNPRETTENYIRTVFKEIIGKNAAKIPSDETFKHNEFTSLAIREIVNEFSKKYGKLPVSLLYEYTTITELTNFFIGEQEKSANQKPIERKAASESSGKEMLLKKVYIKEEAPELEVGLDIIEDVLFCDKGTLPGKEEIKFWLKHSSEKRRLIFLIKEEKNPYDMIKRVFCLLKAVSKSAVNNRMQLTFAYDTCGRNAVYVASLSSLLKTFCAEYIGVSATIVGVKDRKGISLEDLKELLTKENGSASEVKLETTGRYVAYVTQQERAKNHRAILRDDGVYLIAGGTGGIGSELTRQLAGKPLRTLIITSRKMLSIEEKDKFLAEYAEVANVEFVAADLSVEADVKRLISIIKEKYGILNGVFQLAGTNIESLFHRLTWERFCTGTEAKVKGTELLLRYVKDFEPDFIVLFSSVAGTFGNIGQSAYAYANAFLNEVAERYEEDGTISIAWPYWQDGNMKLTDRQKEYFYYENGSMPLPSNEAFALLFDVLGTSTGSLTVLFGDREKLKTKVKHPDFINMDSYDVLKMEDCMDIAIIGLDGKYPMAPNLEILWKNLKQGKDCISEIPGDRWDNQRFYSRDRQKENKYYCKYGGFVENVECFDSLFFGMSPKDATYINPQERIMLEVVWHVLEDAGYTKKRLKNEKVGVYMGVTNSDYKFVGFNKGPDDIKPISDPLASVANIVSYTLDLNGPSMTIDTMCSSSLASLYVACQAISKGECDTAIVGGANLCMHPQKYMALCKEGMLSPNGRCKSFGADADGYVPGEGIGAVMIKHLAKAVNDGDSIYGVIKSCKINHGGHTSGYTVPSPNAQAEVIGDAIRSSGISARTITYVETHGTGTSLGDPIEVTGLRKAFSPYTDDKGFCSIGSIKSNIGHLEGASGIASLTKVLLQFEHKQLVPSIHSRETNPEIDFADSPFYVQQVNEDWVPVMKGKSGKEYPIPRRAAISGFGAGGTNVSLIVEEYKGEEKVFRYDNARHAMLLSAKCDESLTKIVEQMIYYMTDTEDTLAEIAYSLQTTREGMKKRLAFTAATKEEAVKILKSYLKGENAGIYHGNITLHHKNRLDFDDEAVENAILEKNEELLADFWARGIEPGWERLYKGLNLRRVKLPPYPFKRDRHVLEDYMICAEKPAGDVMGKTVEDATEMVEDLNAEELEELLKMYETGDVDADIIKGIIGE